MNKKRGKVTTANESRWWRRAWRWRTWKRLVNVSETSRSQKGNVARFLTAQELLKLTAIMLCGWHCFFLFLTLISVFLCLPYVVQYRVVQWETTQHVAVQGSSELVTGSGQGCEPSCPSGANIILMGVFSVRHIPLRSPPPPPLLVLFTDNSLASPFILSFQLQQIISTRAMPKWLIQIVCGLFAKDLFTLWASRRASYPCLSNAVGFYDRHKQRLAQQPYLLQGYQNASLKGSLQEKGLTVNMFLRSH